MGNQNQTLRQKDNWMYCETCVNRGEMGFVEAMEAPQYVLQVRSYIDETRVLLVCPLGHRYSFYSSDNEYINQTVLPNLRLPTKRCAKCQEPTT